jgi:hypothetical protein
MNKTNSQTSSRATDRHACDRTERVMVGWHALIPKGGHLSLLGMNNATTWPSWRLAVD